MEKIVLTQKTVGNIIGRLKKFMENKVFIKQNHYDKKPGKVRKTIQYTKENLGKEFSSRNYLMNAKVTKHPGTIIKHDPEPLIHVYFHADSATFYCEGDVFYFYGSMILIDEKNDILLKIKPQRKNRVISKLQLVNNPGSELTESIRYNNKMEEEMAEAYYNSLDAWDNSFQD